MLLMTLFVTLRPSVYAKKYFCLIYACIIELATQPDVVQTLFLLSGTF